jgi:hypothetical protein
MKEGNQEIPKTPNYLFYYYFFPYTNFGLYTGAPTDPGDQRSAALRMERNQAPDMNSSCPVVHRTVRCTTRRKARLTFQVGLQRLLAALGL